jgi:hypothetical protein
VIWGSLQTVVPTRHGLDKVEHFGTYLFLAVWFTGLCTARYWMRVGLLALGLQLEVCQWLMHAGRTADPNDMARQHRGRTRLLLARPF